MYNVYNILLSLSHVKMYVFYGKIIFLGELAVKQLVKKFPIFMERKYSGSCSKESAESSLHPCILSVKHRFPITLLAAPLFLNPLPPCFHLKLFTLYLSFPCVLHNSPIELYCLYRYASLKDGDMF